MFSMIGTTLKKLLDEREIKVNEFARQIHVPAQTLYSIIRRDNMKIDFELLLRICDALHVPLETFCGTGSTDQPTPEGGRRSGSCAVWMRTAGS